MTGTQEHPPYTGPKQVIKNLIGDNNQYHMLIAELTDNLSYLETYSEIMTDDLKSRVCTMAKHLSGQSVLDVDEVSRQYQLILKIQEQVVNETGDLLKTSNAASISSMISALNGVISLFMRSQAQLDDIKEQADLKEAVLAAIKDLDDESQSKFFSKLEDLSS